MSEWELYVRQLRDNIYGTKPKFRSDSGWEACKENWMRGDAVIWLEHQPQNAHMQRPNQS